MTMFLRNLFNIDKFLHPKEQGQIYYVNNITGDDDNDGLTPDTAVAQVNQTITLSEANRLARESGNTYIRNKIYVQGTSTAYDAIAALPNYCDIIGIGAAPNGNGTGIPIIGAVGADGIAGTARGLGLYNLQIVSGGAFWCCDFVSLFRSIIKNCCFQSSTTATDGGIRFSGSSGGNQIIGNHWTGNGNVIAKVGIQIQGANFDSNRIEDNVIHGTTAGILVDATCTISDNTIIRKNVIGDLGRGCATAIDDNATAGMINYIGNSVMGSALICCVNNGAARVHGNFSANGYVAVTAS